MSIVLLDCDGVLADFVGHLRAELGKLGHEIGEVTEYDFLRGFGDECGAAARKLLKDGETWREIPPYDEAIELVDSIESTGHEVVVVTSPWHSCADWASVRREWLDWHFGIHPRNLIVTQRKDLVRGDAFVDDRPDAVLAWAERNGSRGARLMQRSWTVSAPLALMRFSWTREDVDALLGEIGGAR